MSDELDAARQRMIANAMRAGDEVARFIGMCVLAGESFPRIVEQLEQMIDSIKRDAAINSQMATLNPFVHVLEASIEKLRERC